jgi:hypothetical protein
MYNAFIEQDFLYCRLTRVKGHMYEYIRTKCRILYLIYKYSAIFFTALLAIYAPMIYKSPCVILLMRAVAITRASGRGVGSWKLRLFWALLNGIEPIGECHLGPKKVEISLPDKHLPQNLFTVNFFRWRHFALPSMSLIFLRRRGIAEDQNRISNAV